MKKKIIVSVGCEYGCMGPEIGRKIAKDYNIAYYDRELIDEIMEEAGFSHDLTEKAEQGIDVRGRNTGNAGTARYADLTDRMVYIQSEVIKKLADRGSCVFIGRCSDYILRHREDCLNIFIYAPYNVRVKNVMKAHGLSKEDAEILIEENDKMLHARYMQMTGTYRGDRHNRHLLIDSDMLGFNGTVEMIENLIDKVFEGEQIYGREKIV